MALSELAIRNAKPGAKPAKLFDGRGLHLVITPAGGKLWRLKFRFAGKEKLLSLGAYPTVTLAGARRAADKAREDLAAGNDPALEKRRAKARAKAGADDTFASIAKEYIGKRKADGSRPYSAATAVKAEWFAELLRPAIGHMPVTSIEPADILAALRKLVRILLLPGADALPGFDDVLVEVDDPERVPLIAVDPENHLTDDAVDHFSHQIAIPVRGVRRSERVASARHAAKPFPLQRPLD